MVKAEDRMCFKCGKRYTPKDQNSLEHLCPACKKKRNLDQSSQLLRPYEVRIMVEEDEQQICKLLESNGLQLEKSGSVFSEELYLALTRFGNKIHKWKPKKIEELEDLKKGLKVIRRARLSKKNQSKGITLLAYILTGFIGFSMFLPFILMILGSIIGMGGV